MRMTEIEMRKMFLRQFDEYVREKIGDDEITCNVWLAEGVPDGYDDEELDFIANDEECWLSCVDAFAKCCRLAGIIE